MTEEAKPSRKTRILEELRNLSITVVYLWILLSAAALHRQIILADYNIHFPEKFGFALINALILAKFMWLGEILHAGKRAVGKALLVATLWNSAVFGAILLVCHVVEEGLLRWWHGEVTGRSFSQVTGIRPAEAAGLALLMFVVLIPFFFTKGLLQILGKDEVKRLLLRTESKKSNAEEIRA